ncbi:MAG: hypothetical protein DRP87_02005 [Spirochaetes bacterium]|nr:MAG: hypothetical protein DRP87_02005 [Spirochaetota bacterium]
MLSIKYRRTFSLDEDAKRRLKTLAACLNVSRAEVIRRVLKKERKRKQT